jgi:hypothetical protein
VFDLFCLAGVLFACCEILRPAAPSVWNQSVATANISRSTITKDPTQTSSPVNLAHASPVHLASRPIRLAPPSSAPSVDRGERTASRAFKLSERPTLSAQGSATAITAFARTMKSTNCASGKISRTAGPTGSERNSATRRTTWPQMSGRATLKTTSIQTLTTCIHTASKNRNTGRNMIEDERTAPMQRHCGKVLGRLDRRGSRD